MSSRPSPAHQPLHGIRILDFTRVLAGPYGTMHLADLGADVVKVEHPSGGDDTRSYGPPFQDGISTYFLSINRGKRSVALDLKHPEDRATARALALHADVVFENFRPGVMARLGLDAETLRTEKPALICCTIRAFADADDPRPGYDLMIQGLSGIPSITGPVDGEPYKCGASIADMTSGMHAVQAICAALFHRERTGEGSSIVIPLMDSQRSLLTYHASAWLNGGSPSQRRGNHHPSIHPFCVLPTADGHICLCIGNDKLWRAFCVVAGAPALGKDPRFITNRLRVANRAALDAWIEPTVAARTLDDWLQSLAAAGVPAGPMRSVEAALEDADLVEHAHPVSGAPVRTLPVPILIDGERPTAARAPSLLGADTAAVCAEWLPDRD
jgi:formyl-CoA transferase